MLGTRLALGSNPSDRRSKIRTSNNDFLVKLLVALIISIGWVYVLNPEGRGASITENFMVSFNPTAEETLPIYLSSNNNLAVIICGFLGWYLQLLTHFFIKVALNDATSTKVYGSLFRRFILIWGIAMVLGDTLDIDRYRSCPRCG